MNFFRYVSYFDDEETMKMQLNEIRTEGAYATYRTIRIAADYIGLSILIHRHRVSKNRYVDDQFAFLVKKTVIGALHIRHTGAFTAGHFEPVLF